MVAWSAHWRKRPVGFGGTWSRDGVILFVRNPASAIARVSAEGGPAVDVTTRLDAGQVGHAFPHFLPDGKHFLYYHDRWPGLARNPRRAARWLVVAPPASMPMAGGVYTNGHVLFIRQSNVLAQPFDAERLELKGNGHFKSPTGVYSAAGGQYDRRSRRARPEFVISALGTARFARQFTWVDRSGNQIATVGDPLRQPGRRLRVHRIAVNWCFFERGCDRAPISGCSILARGLVSRFTDDDRRGHLSAVELAMATASSTPSARNGQMSLYQKAQSAPAVGELLIPPETRRANIRLRIPHRTAVTLLYQRMNPKTGWDIWALPLRVPNAAAALGAPLGRQGESAPVVQTEADERAARLSPDGRWVAFVSNTSGVSEVLRAAVSGTRTAIAGLHQGR